MTEEMLELIAEARDCGSVETFLDAGSVRVEAAGEGVIWRFMPYGEDYREITPEQAERALESDGYEYES